MEPDTSATNDPSALVQREGIDPLEDPAPEAPGPDDSEPGFGNLGLAPPIAQAVIELGYETPTPVQRRCIPELLAGRDLLGQAQTGTGKTAAFALPLLSRIDSASKLPQVLVLTPTRELALQVAEAFQRYAQHLKGFHVLPIYGGQSYGLQVRQLQRIPQVVVGTPGRIMDHMRRDTLSLGALKALVLDEADEMLNMGFAEDIDWIFQHTPPERQVALFSATMPAEILKVAREHLNDPVEVRVESATVTVETIDQQHCVVTRYHKADVLTRILELETFDGMLIFVRTKGGTTELADKLRAQGFAAEPLNGDMNQEMRERTVDRLKGGQLDILVATDVAARGLDVERVSHVVNYDIPTDPSAYVHRIGRTGRAGRSGKAILLVEPRERGLLRAIERTIRRPIPEMDVPSAAQLSASRIDRFTEQLRATLVEQDLDFFYRLVAHIAKDQELDLMDIAAALSFQLQRERPLEVKEAAKEPPRERRPEGRGERRWESRRDQDQGGERRQYQGRARPPGGYRDRERPAFPVSQRSSERGDRYQRGRDDKGQGPHQVPSEGSPGWRGTKPAGRPHRGPDLAFGREPSDEGRGSAGTDPRGYPDTRSGRGSRLGGQGRRTEPDQPRHGGEPHDLRGERVGPRFPGPGGDERPPRQRAGGRGAPEMVMHRIEVGHRDGVTPREIVGAIANESGLEGRFIGSIDIREDYSTVALPSGMPRELFAHLKRVYVRGRPLRISVVDARSAESGRPPRDAGDRPPRRHRSDEGGRGTSRPGTRFHPKRRD